MAEFGDHQKASFDCGGAGAERPTDTGVPGPFCKQTVLLCRRHAAASLTWLSRMT